MSVCPYACVCLFVLFFFLCTCLCLSVCLSVCPCLYLSAFVVFAVYQHLCRLPFCLRVGYVFVPLYLSLSTCLFCFLSVSLFVSVFVYVLVAFVAHKVCLRFLYFPLLSSYFPLYSNFVFLCSFVCLTNSFYCASLCPYRVYKMHSCERRCLRKWRYLHQKLVRVL